ncbi:hypothetical protein [Pseudosulfitobacter pseudonitzschiae]|uniref:hypothetical protein n=1 Tax=Pseudosulfitobacter pseudonitzschiae TaxID=1402135 RepID=UPI001AF3014B|nr:hypothetical protein [Pseudosulfitobacter pseudonitzschiae]MBM1813440.1 hypothetical protein [Pseudosulfitobacter pseudonitzschiae]MBM1830433.1 hypothetical protein [Pseudosulfitobacter pseudonitzschiae]MBM1835300.1 hypothetical protein [Pseudosulfitobacter pseudonitzschiae]MBM1840146.1 hypothetical protein [Pseudosulfitobacter pseudonitzschiae]MBM1845866.1 hypothetical protein [Pseudosulfitobacter pseudonitzschiae]
MNSPKIRDPYEIRSIEQLLSLFDGGEFLTKVMEGHSDLQIALLDHRAEHNGKTKGSMTIQVGYDLGKQGDVSMAASVTFTTPKKPPSSAQAFIGDQGELTLYSPLMRRMQPGVRDVSSDNEIIDPDTGEVTERDAG